MPVWPTLEENEAYVKRYMVATRDRFIDFFSITVASYRLNKHDLRRTLHRLKAQLALEDARKERRMEEMEEWRQKEERWQEERRRRRGSLLQVFASSWKYG